jgi:predicted Zn-dependent protease
MVTRAQSPRFRLSPYLRVAVLGALAVALAGCGSVPRSDRPASVESRGEAPPPQATAEQAPRIAAYTPPTLPRHVRPEPKRAVEVLQARAVDQRRSGDHAGAIASLERALRMDPGNPLLWHELAAVRLAQGEHGLVTQLAAKSNSLADPADASLRRANWLLIAESRDALGDRDGAAEARRFAAGR